MSARRECSTGKIPFSRKGAEREVSEWKPARGFVRSYQCPFCGWFHLTSRPERVPVVMDVTGKGLR